MAEEARAIHHAPLWLGPQGGQLVLGARSREAVHSTPVFTKDSTAQPENAFHTGSHPLRRLQQVFLEVFERKAVPATRATQQSLPVGAGI